MAFNSCFFTYLVQVITVNPTRNKYLSTNDLLPFMIRTFVPIAADNTRRALNLRFNRVWPSTWKLAKVTLIDRVREFGDQPWLLLNGVRVPNYRLSTKSVRSAWLGKYW